VAISSAVTSASARYWSASATRCSAARAASTTASAAVVGHRRESFAEPVGDVGDPVGFGVKQAQQFQAGHLGPSSRGYRHRPGRPWLRPGRRLAAALGPGRHTVVAASFTALRKVGLPCRGGSELSAARMLARVPNRGVECRTHCRNDIARFTRGGGGCAAID
jgi:hypothetical protein